jgi:hypothetical protein
MPDGVKYGASLSYLHVALYSAAPPFLCIIKMLSFNSRRSK